MFGLFKKKDPVCGMHEKKGKGITKEGNWFCSSECLDKYTKDHKQKKHGCGCCP